MLSFLTSPLLRMQECKEKMSDFNVETLIFDNGERYPVLIDEDGMPHFHVTLWVTSKLRLKGLAQSTITNKIRHIKRLLTWARNQQIDLFSQFKEGNFLKLHDIEQLKTFISINLLQKNLFKATQRNKIILFDKAIVNQQFIPTNGSSHQSDMITSIADYLVFIAQLATQFNPTLESNQNIKEMEKLLKSCKPKNKNKKNVNRSLSVPEQLAREFMSIAHFENVKNPFVNEGVRFRNHLMFSLLESLGLRRGEMLSMKLTNLVLHGSEKTIMVTRSHDDEYDSRKRQPVAKTKERQLAISDSLAEEISLYIKKYRSKIPNSGKHPYLFVTHKASDTQGKPISGSSFDNTIVPTMRSVDERFLVIYPHYFRHDWNERFSNAVDKINREAESEKEKISPDKEAKMRKHQMGHSLEESGNTYNQRHVVRRANELVLIEQQELEASRKDYDGE
jgi:integrase